ncbi:MAG: hypothetical protein LBB40_05385 [Holophagales bacterium]|nr:hypothetical protein [Holophagales bacterium]
MWLAAIISEAEACIAMKLAKLKPELTFLMIFVMAAISGAQDFFWRNQSARLPWRNVEPRPEPQRVQIKQPNANLTVKVDRDGTIAIFNKNKIRLLRFGLPGRPILMWRDAGQPIVSFGQFSFPSHTPLSANFKKASEKTSDFLNNLAGLLWILDDGEQYLTIVHSATCQYAFINLPGGRDMELRFHPDHLELCERGYVDGDSNAWALSWNELLPVLQALATPPPQQPQGSAFVPYSQ